MNHLLALPISLSAIMLCLSDFKFRYVSLNCLLAYIVSAALYGVASYGIRLMLAYSIIGSCLSIIMFGLICVYFRLKEGQGCKVVDTKIGQGDLYFYLASSLAFEPAVLLMLYVVSGLTGLIYHCVSRKDSIPLIGMSVPWVLLYIIIQMFI